MSVVPFSYPHRHLHLPNVLLTSSMPIVALACLPSHCRHISKLLPASSCPLIPSNLLCEMPNSTTSLRGNVPFAGDAANIFAAVSDFSPQRTALIIDPPRKGCDENFIDQLLTFKAQTVVYVSCNVHTQARDVGMILKRSENEAERNGGRYVLESLRGFDLFPQTAHVESIAVLRLIQATD